MKMRWGGSAVPSFDLTMQMLDWGKLQTKITGGGLDPLPVLLEGDVLVPRRGHDFVCPVKHGWGGAEEGAKGKPQSPSPSYHVVLV